MKIAMIQMLVTPGAPEENLRRAELRVAEAAEKGCDCAVLPECMDLGWAAASALEKAEPIPGKTSDRLCALARRHRICLVAGITERDESAFYNTSLFISRDGEIRGRHRKISLVDGVEGCYKPGCKVEAIETEFGKIGITICADNLLPTISFAESLAHMGVKLILSPSAWAVPPERLNAPYGEEWFTPYRRMALEYGVSVVGVSNVGEVREGLWKGWKCIGHSIAALADGETVVLPHGELAETLRVFTVTP